MKLKILWLKFRWLWWVLTPSGSFIIVFVLLFVSAFSVLDVTQKTRTELHKKEQLLREREQLLEERDNLFLEKEVLTNSLRIELLATYELNMRPMQPIDNASGLILQ